MKKVRRLNLLNSLNSLRTLLEDQKHRMQSRKDAMVVVQQRIKDFECRRSARNGLKLT